YQIARSILGNEFLAKPRDFEKWVTTEWGEKPNGWSNPVQDYIPKSLDDNQRKNLHALMQTNYAAGKQLLYFRDTLKEVQHVMEERKEFCDPNWFPGLP